MGAYLSSPIREKVSEDDERTHLRYGASSMQGWRMSQEDAHNCCPDFDVDTNTSLFACYDGHGGAEVAQYTAQKLPDFIKSLPLYMESKLSDALEEGFLEFDATLTKEDVIQKLKELACLEEDGEQEEGEAETLYEEATMPLEELLERYGRGGARKKLLAKDSIQSPAIRPKKESQLGDGDNKDDVKMKLENELMNGHGEGENGLETVTSPDDSNLHQANEAQAKEESDSSKPASIEGGSSCVDSTTTDEPPKETSDCDSGNKENVADSNQASSTGNSDSPQPPEPSTASSSTADGAQETEGPSSTSSSAHDSKPKVASGSGDLSSSSSCGVGSTSSVGGSGVASSTSSAGGSGSSGCAGGSGSGGVGSSGSSASASGSGSSSSDMGPCSSSKEEEPQAGSSSGRFRHTRKNIIPAEGEDESSFDEDSEDDSDSGDEDEPRPWASGSDDSSEEDEGMPESEEDEDEEDGCGEMGSGEPGSDSGCTAVVCLLRGRELYVANSGDSRCVVSRGGKAMDMSVDHKPEDEVEHSRVIKAGGRVTLDGRVNGGLNMSRAIGDHCYKQNKDLPAREQMITALPDVRSTTLEDRDDFMVLACDGIWNVMSSQDVVNFVSERLKGGATKMSAICEEMFDYCLAPDTTGDGTGCDNMTCIIVTFNHSALDAMGSASKKRQASDSQETDTPDLPDVKKQKTEETASL